MSEIADELARAIGAYAETLCGLTKVTESSVGGFVWTSDSYGIGKLVSICDGRARVRFFHAITQTEEREYRAVRLGRACLRPQTRVYVHDDKTGLWRIGRIGWQFREGDQFWYGVQFPNKVIAEFSETMLEVRCLRPKVDPTEVLASGGMETQFYHDRRWAAIRALTSVRAASRGLTGLVSASVELVPHQVEVVRRALEDPILRYVLADEVGLGKTIEAAAIIRQRLLDDPEARVLILAPDPLVRQWERELRDKFHVDEFPERVTVSPFQNIPILKEGECDLLVIDEAHLLVGRMRPGSTTYTDLARLAHSSRGLLLISATPMLSNDDATHALFHLLDPVTFSLQDRDVIHERIHRRQEYGRRLLSLNPKVPTPVLNRALAQVLETFPDDPTIGTMVARLQEPCADVEQIVAILKKHISETYRLHQRLLRTRRRDLEGWELLPRRSSLAVDADLDERVAPLWERLEDWRYASRAALQDRIDKARTCPDEYEFALASRYRTLVEALGCGVEELSRELELQWQDVYRQSLPTFSDEQGILELAREAASGDSDFVDVSEELTTFVGHRHQIKTQVAPRVALAVQEITLMIMGTPRGSRPKIVAFSSSNLLAHQVYECLLSINGQDVVFGIFEEMSIDEIEQVVILFERSAKPSVIVCDRTGELGLNLHFAYGVVHLDLPLAPTRLEQRIGRVDRFGRQHEVIRQRITLPTDDDASPWVAWYELLRDGFGIFNESISEVHFILEELERDIVLALYRQGASGLRSMTADVRQRLKEERERLDEQYALDRLTIGEEEAESFFANLQETDKQESELGDAIHQWLVAALQVSHQVAADVACNAFTYRWSDHTLAPEWPWRVFLAVGLDQPHDRRYLTFDRSVARKHPEVLLVRPGFSFIDRIERFMIWDDRGAAFATWRQDARWASNQRGEWLGFRLCYVVEADMAKIAWLLSEKLEPRLLPSVYRRADSLVAPWTEVLYVGMDLQEVADLDLCAILERPYSNRIDAVGQRDFNLGSRIESLLRVIDPQAFVDICRDVRRRSEEIVRASPRFRDLTASISEHVLRELSVRNAQLHRRNEALARETGRCDPTIDMEITINDAVAAGAMAPEPRLDSIGFFVVSGSPPPGVGDDG